jgi:hypothetical protein
MGEVHAIMNLEKYAAYIRRRAALSFSEDHEENLDDFITIAQTSSLIEEHSVGRDEEGRLLIDEDANKKLFEAVRVMLYNAGLSKLAAKDLLECAWDEKKGEMVFWAKNKSGSDR